MAKLRLRAYLMRSGEFDKAYRVIKLIKGGRIFVNGKPVRNPEFSVKTNDKIEVWEDKGKKELKLKPFVYIIFNKPAGYICQKSNNEDTVYNLIDRIKEIDEETKKTLFVVGRLDRDTEGLLLITNDGRIGNDLVKPEKHITKTYLVETENVLTETDLSRLKNGVVICLEDGKHNVKAVGTKLLGEKSAEVVIDEGKKRQIRLMFEVIGNRVAYLKRVAIGKLRLEDIDFGGKNYIVFDRKTLQVKLGIGE